MTLAESSGGITGFGSFVGFSGGITRFMTLAGSSGGITGFGILVGLSGDITRFMTLAGSSRGITGFGVSSAMLVSPFNGYYKILLKEDDLDSPGHGRQIFFHEICTPLHLCNGFINVITRHL
jgi:hypothetical protein